MFDYRDYSVYKEYYFPNDNSCLLSDEEITTNNSDGAETLSQWYDNDSLDNEFDLDKTPF